jgi:hypothetical protein
MAAFAGENGKEAEKVTPVLKPDPKITAILNSLGDCSSANLPPIKTMGEWNETSKRYGMERTGPVGRDFCIKAVWAPERKRALFCGGNHGSPHRLNDAWEYDLPSNTWVMLFGPDPNKPRKNWHDWAKKVATVKDGVVMSKRGGPLDTWHTWWQVTYDPNMKALIWANPKSVEDKVPDVLGMSEAEKAKLYKGHPFWLFYPEEKKWKPLKTEPPYPTRKVGGAQAMEYIPDLGGPVFYAANWFAQGMWVYNPKTNKWKDLKANGGKGLYHNKTTPRSETIMAWDPENKVLVGVWGTCTYHYELAKNEWSKVIDEPKESTKVPYGHDARSPIGYDPVGKVVVIYDPKTPAHIWAYSVKEKKWTKNEVKGPPGPKGKLIGYWDPARNAMVVDSRGKVWVCRYKKAGAKESSVRPAAPNPAVANSRPAAPKKAAPVAAPAPAKKAPTAARKRTPEQVCTGWFSAARNYRNAGMLADARRCLGNVIRDYPETEWAQEARQELAKLETP